jgi:hypothetical protein
MSRESKDLVTLGQDLLALGQSELAHHRSTWRVQFHHVSRRGLCCTNTNALQAWGRDEYRPASRLPFSRI